MPSELSIPSAAAHSSSGHDIIARWGEVPHWQWHCHTVPHRACTHGPISAVGCVECALISLRWNACIICAWVFRPQFSANSATVFRYYFKVPYCRFCRVPLPGGRGAMVARWADARYARWPPFNETVCNVYDSDTTFVTLTLVTLASRPRRPIRSGEGSRQASERDGQTVPHVDKKATTVRLISQSVIAHHTPTC